MQPKVYNIEPLCRVFDEWYSPEEMHQMIDEVMFYYATTRMNEGTTGADDAKTLHILKMLRDAIRQA